MRFETRFDMLKVGDVIEVYVRSQQPKDVIYTLIKVTEITPDNIICYVWHHHQEVHGGQVILHKHFLNDFYSYVKVDPRIWNLLLLEGKWNGESYRFAYDLIAPGRVWGDSTGN